MSPSPASQEAVGGEASSRRGSLHVALSVLAFAAVALLVWSFWLPAEHRYFNYETRTHGFNWDLKVYYAAGNNWALGIDPYGNQYQPPTVKITGRAPIRFKGQTTVRFIYLPTLLPAYRWLAHLPYRKLRYDWLYLNFAVLAAAAVVAVALERGRRLEVTAAILLLGVVSFPLLYHIREGNIDMIVAGLATSGFLLYGRYRSWPAAILLALAVVTKLTPLLVVAALGSYYRDWRFLAKTLSATAVLVALSLIWVPAHFYDEAAHVLFVRSRSMTGYVNQSAMRLLFNVPWGARIAGVLAFAGLLVGLYALGRRRMARTDSIARHGEAPDVKVFMLTVLVMLLFSPIAWIWTYVWVIIPLAMLLVGRQRVRGTAALAMLLVAAALMSAPIARHGPVLDLLTMLGGVVGLACLVLCVIGVIDVGHKPGAAASLR